MSIEPGSPPPLLGTLDYLAEVAKDWAQHQFAAAKRSDFALAPHRFELRGTRVRRRRIPPGTPEAESPLAIATATTGPTAWAARTPPSSSATPKAGPSRMNRKSSRYWLSTATIYSPKPDSSRGCPDSLPA